MILPKAADYIEADFNEAYFTESKYKESRKKHADDISEKISPFKFCIADFLRKKAKMFRINMYKKLKCLKI